MSELKIKQQGIYVSYSTLKFKGLKLIDKIVYSILEDRMKSSIKRKNFFDKNRQDYYVIYDQNKLAEFIGVHPNTIFNSLKKLNNLSYIDRDEQQYSADKIFMPKSVLTKIVYRYSQKLCTNHFIKPFDFSLSIDTIDSSNLKFIKDKSSVDESNSNSKNNNDNKNENKETNPKHKITDEDRIFNIGFKMKKYGMSDELVWTLKKYSYGKPNILTKYKNVLFTTKSTILNQYKNKKEEYKIVKNALTFEINATLSAEVLNNIKHIIIESDSKNSKIKSKYAYMGSAMRKVYKQIAEDWIHPEKTETKIENKIVDGKPTVNVYKSYGNSRKPIIESVPEWAKKYNHIDEPMTQDEMKKHMGKMENDPFMKQRRQRSIDKFRDKIEREKKLQAENRERINKQLKEEAKQKELKKEKNNKQKEERHTMTLDEYLGNSKQENGKNKNEGSIDFSNLLNDLDFGF